MHRGKGAPYSIEKHHEHWGLLNQEPKVGCWAPMVTQAVLEAGGYQTQHCQGEPCLRSVVIVMITTSPIALQIWGQLLVEGPPMRYG